MHKNVLKPKHAVSRQPLASAGSIEAVVWQWYPQPRRLAGRHARMSMVEAPPASVNHMAAIRESRDDPQAFDASCAFWGSHDRQNQIDGL
jgi:hypothetical protein